MGNENFFSGCIPALMTPCDAKGVPDLDALVTKGKQLVNAGMKSVVYCGSMGLLGLINRSTKAGRSKCPD